MTAIVPVDNLLTGRFVRLAPLAESDLGALFDAIGQPAVFAGGYGGGPHGLARTREAFAEWAKGYYNWGTGIVFGVWIAGGPHDGELVGTSSLTRFDLPSEAAEIGWTAFAPKVWGTQVNLEAKLLMLSHAFAHGFGRIRIAADMRNERSRAAITGIGATFEGVVRRDKLRADGSWRDTAQFSIIVDDWPRVLAGLTERLAPYGDRPVLFRTPPATP